MTHRITLQHLHDIVFKKEYKHFNNLENYIVYFTIQS